MTPPPWGRAVNTLIIAVCDASADGGNGVINMKMSRDFGTVINEIPAL